MSICMFYINLKIIIERMLQNEEFKVLPTEDHNGVKEATLIRKLNPTLNPGFFFKERIKHF